MSLTLTPVLIQFVSWGTYTIGGLIGLLIITLVIWLYMWRPLSSRFHPSVPLSVNGPELGSKPPKLSNRDSLVPMDHPFDAPLPPRWKNGRRFPPANGNLGRKPPSG